MSNNIISENNSIIILDDDVEVCSTVRRLLESANFKVTIAHSGSEMQEFMIQEKFGLAIVDLNLPDIDGLDVVRNIRENFSTAIMILSGRSDTIEKIIGLEVGADDFLAKPFDGRELLARVRSILRRFTPTSPDKSNLGQNILRFDGWSLNLDDWELRNPQSEVVALTSGEFTLLHIFLQNSGRILSRETLMDKSYGNYTPAFDRSIDVKIGRLRKKIELNQDQPKMIKTVRNAGYIFSVRVEK